jgi:hypothetical protein
MICECAAIRKHCRRQHGKLFPFAVMPGTGKRPRDWRNRQATHDHLKARLWADSTSAALRRDRQPNWKQPCSDNFRKLR